MTPADLEKAGHRLFGRKKWKPQLAAALGVNTATVFRMMHRAEVSGPCTVAIKALLENKRRIDELNKEADRLLRDRKRLKHATEKHAREKKRAAARRKLVPYAGSPELEKHEP